MGADVSKPDSGLVRDLGLSVGSNTNAEAPSSTQDDDATVRTSNLSDREVGAEFQREVKALKGTFWFLVCLSWFWCSR